MPVDQPRPAVPLRPHRATRARLALHEGRDRRGALDVRVSDRLPRPVRLQRRPALLPGRRRRPRLHLRRRRHAALRRAPTTARSSGRSTRKTEFGVVQNFFGVGSTPVVEGDLLIVQIGGSPKGSDDVDFDDLKGNGTGVVAFDKYTGKVQLQGSATNWPATPAPCWRRSTAGAGASSSPAAGCSAFDPATGKVDFHFPWRAEHPRKRQRRQPRRRRRPACFISEIYGPGSALLKVKPGGYEVVWTDDEQAAATRACSATG